nr:DUF3558 domain-containing protein [Tamaricihabitans halophyticus]
MAGCTQTEAGQPVDTAENPPSSSAAEQPGDEVPKVQDPLDLAKFEQDPCSSLTVSQLDDLGVNTTGEAKDDIFGPVCRWKSDGVASVSVYYTVKGAKGMAQEYANRDQHAYFEPMEPVRGYPLVARATDNPENITRCDVAVGVTDESIVQISITQSLNKEGKEDPCVATRRVVEMVVETWKAGGA